MRQFWKRWLGLLLFVAVLGTTFVLLGRWQLNRLAERKHNNAVVIAHESGAPLPFGAAFRGPVGDQDQWQRVTVTGTYDDAETIRIRYRSNGGVQGSEFVTPLHADDGRTVLVDRGYAAATQGEEPTAPPAPSGPVTVTGYVRRDEAGPANARDPQNRQARLIDSRAIQATLPYPVVDGYLSVATQQPPDTLTPVPTPELDNGPHLSYAIQWFCFCAMAVVGLVVFIRGDIVAVRRARLKAAQAAAGEAPTQPKDPA